MPKGTFNDAFGKADDKPKDEPERKVKAKTPDPEPKDDHGFVSQGIRQETDPGAAQDDPDAGVVH